MRNRNNLYPNYSDYIKEIDENGITPDLIVNIMQRHRNNTEYTKQLHERYNCLEESVPIFSREPRFNNAAINRKINNDFFSEIVDFKTGYFAGKAASYGYANTEESETTTGGTENIEKATKALTDFITRNNMYDVDMQVTKYAAIAGYAGRLFYHDKEGNERVVVLPAYEVIILANNNITEPEYALRHYKLKDVGGKETLYVEFYSRDTIKFYEGTTGLLKLVDEVENLYDFCPLQGISNNDEMLGDAEKVLSLIDAYDRTISDSSNEIESSANSYMVFENVSISDDEIQKAQSTGAIQFYSGSSGGKVYFLNKDINGSFIENYLDRIMNNIYRFSKTINLNDDNFTQAASGISLKYKLLGLEAKCGMFEAKMMSAAVYMFKLLCSSWSKKGVPSDYLQCYVEFSRNFPLDIASEAQAVQQLMSAGLPKRIAWEQLSFIDDMDYVFQLLEEEKEDIPSLMDYDETLDQEEEEEKPKQKETKWAYF